jgi:hypothetical protein
VLWPWCATCLLINFFPTTTKPPTILTYYSTGAGMASSERRPLQDLPLERFTGIQHKSVGRPDSLKSPSGSLLPIKRSADSPGLLLSPAKRRLLAQAVIRSPEFTSSPLASSSRLTTVSPRSGPGLGGTEGPSRKLDFDATTPETKAVIPGRASHLAPSPILQEAKIASSAPNSAVASMNHSIHRHAPDSPPLLPAHVPRMVIREQPSLPGSSSIHYPGFDTYTDKHLHVPHVWDRVVAADVEDEMSTREADKENMPARRRTKKLSVALGERDFQAALLSAGPLRT